MRFGLKAFPIAALLAVAGSIQAATGPIGYVIADGERIDIPVSPTGDGDTWAIGGETGWSTQNSEFSCSVTGLMDPDPSIGYGIAVTDFGAPSTFLFVFSTPIVSTGAPNWVRASAVGGLTDSTGNGASITPSQLDAAGDGDTIPEIQLASVGLPLTNMGVDVGGTVIVPPGAPGALTGYGPYAAGWQPGPGPGPWGTLQTSTGFTLSGGSDIFSLTGYAEIVVPEPTSLALLALAPMIWRRRRA